MGGEGISLLSTFVNPLLKDLNNICGRMCIFVFKSIHKSTTAQFHEKPQSI